MSALGLWFVKSFLSNFPVEPNSVTINKKCHVTRSVSITCNVAAGNPIPDVAWTKNGVKLTSGMAFQREH